MNAAATSADTLLARFAGLADCGNADGFACISARREHGARSVDIAQPQLAVLLQGRKRIDCDGEALSLAAGDLFVITRACRIDAINTPDPDSGLYLSVIVPLCEDVLTAARALWSEPLPTRGAGLVQLPLAEFAPTLLQWRQALQDGHYSEARLALATLAVALCRRGHGALLLPPPPSLGARIRGLVAAQPERDWQSRDFEHTLGLSGATLRRRLSAEHTSLRELIADARLARAMALLYTTHWPLKTVAARVGYRSVASFQRRFVARYGMEPAAIGNA